MARKLGCLPVRISESGMPGYGGGWGNAIVINEKHHTRTTADS